MTIDDLTPSTLSTVPDSYAAGESELETIARAIEQGAIPIDKLSLAVNRADFLNRHLEQQLLNIERDLKQLGLQSTSAGEQNRTPEPK
jgi:exonuclease VII small subunit